MLSQIEKRQDGLTTDRQSAREQHHHEQQGDCGEQRPDHRFEARDVLEHPGDLHDCDLA
jgi:hypothetical protein